MQRSFTVSRKGVSFCEFTVSTGSVNQSSKNSHVGKQFRGTLQSSWNYISTLKECEQLTQRNSSWWDVLLILGGHRQWRLELWRTVVFHSGRIWFELLNKFNVLLLQLPRKSLCCRLLRAASWGDSSWLLKTVARRGAARRHSRWCALPDWAHLIPDWDYLSGVVGRTECYWTGARKTNPALSDHRGGKGTMRGQTN